MDKCATTIHTYADGEIHQNSITRRRITYQNKRFGTISIAIIYVEFTSKVAGSVSTRALCAILARKVNYVLRKL